MNIQIRFHIFLALTWMNLASMFERTEEPATSDFPFLMKTQNYQRYLFNIRYVAFCFYQGYVLNGIGLRGLGSLLDRDYVSAQVIIMGI